MNKKNYIFLIILLIVIYFSNFNSVNSYNNSECKQKIEVFYATSVCLNEVLINEFLRQSARKVIDIEYHNNTLVVLYEY